MMAIALYKQAVSDGVMEEYYCITKGNMLAYIRVSEGYVIEELNNVFDNKWRRYVWDKGERNWHRILMANPEIDVSYELNEEEYWKLRFEATLDMN